MLYKAQLFTNDNKKGFTLVELMVGMIVAMIVMGMTYSIFTSQLRLTKTEMSINDLQLNTQTTLRYLSKKLRNLGYGVTTKVPVPTVMWFDGDQAGTGSGTSNLTIWPTDRLTSSDVLAFYSSDVPSEIKLVSYQGSSNVAYLKEPNIFSGGNVSDYINNLLLIFDSANQTYQVVKITNLTTGQNSGTQTKVDFDTGWGDNLSTGRPFNPSSAVYLGDYNMVYVDNNNVLRIFTPTGENIPLMNNVLSMQVMVGRDTDGDNQVDSWTANESDLSDLYEAKAVKIFIVTTTSHEEKGVTVDIMEKINQLDTNSGGFWSQEVNWNAVLSNYAATHGGAPGVPRVYSFACELRNVYTCN